MLLEAVYTWWPSEFRSFTYRARNPMVVGRRQTINAVRKDVNKDFVHVWCQDDDGVVGMTGRVEIEMDS
jgi:hydroxyacyl-ACP dehydratase HTD2-like protein with hotdog domain